MDVHSSLDLLAHFDEPANVATTRALPTRGIGWVVKWFATLAVLFISACILADFGYCLAVEQALSRAARAGALEATLPRATLQSIGQSVERRLEGYSLLPSRLQLSVMQNGRPVRGKFQPHAGDQITVAVSLSNIAVVPNWLQRALLWRRESQIQASAESRIPGRELKIAAQR